MTRTTTNEFGINRSDFPDSFLWGAATASHQVEGGTINQWSVWERAIAARAARRAARKLTGLESWSRVKAEATNPDNYIAGDSTRHYDLYQADFDTLRDTLHMNTFRFGIEWSRVQPDGPDSWNEAAIRHYRRYIDELKNRGITPLVTLWHYTVPVWFDELGAFEKKANVAHFTRYIERLINDMGKSRLPYICTMNEPEVYTSESYIEGEWPPNRHNPALSFVVYNNLAAAHNEAYTIIKRFNPSCQVGLTKNSAHNYPGDTSALSKLTVAGVNYTADYYFYDKTKMSLDWMGLNYYFSNCYVGLRQIRPEHDPKSDMGWNMRPADIELVVKRLYDRYEIPIIVTENGLADAQDTQRQWWIQQTISGLKRAVDDGVEVRGYLHWSLLDNFEWAKGKWPRFGLVQVDYNSKDKTRTVRQSALWYGRWLGAKNATK